MSREDIQLVNNEGIILASSTEVAKRFGKEHSKVIDKIESLFKEMSPNLALSMFIKNTYKDTMNRNQDEYLLTRDGFSLLVMGFNGKKALKFKLDYIDAFNKMEQTLKESSYGSFAISDLEERCKVWLQEQKQRQLLLEQNEVLLEEMKDKDIIIDVFIADEGLYSVGLVGKVLKKYNSDLGRNGIFAYLRNEKILMNAQGTMKHNLHYSTYDKYFATKLRGLNPCTFINKDGIKWLVKRLNKQGLININKEVVLKEIDDEVMKGDINE
ncbi:Rha family transcriptional regulator [Romboutsia lituseburensis]|uniref:Rha family transcriptional regulator n=1 Tax=Romboutsia lituseburensis TaxID=1537 RepID=UPI0022EB8751|nr:Rha family transcriptional regulator [Romboutsia lituseburensis]